MIQSIIAGGVKVVETAGNNPAKWLPILKENGIKSEILTGSTSQKERDRIIRDLHQGRCTTLVATGQLIGEGFDLPGISTLFLTTPVKFSGRLVQYIGRALRPSPGKKKAVIFDFVDILNPVFEASAKSRALTYEQQNISMEEPPGPV